MTSVSFSCWDMERQKRRRFLLWDGQWLLRSEVSDRSCHRRCSQRASVLRFPCPWEKQCPEQKDSSGLVGGAVTGSVPSFPYPALSLPKALRVLIQLARQAALQWAGQAFELGSVVIWLVWKQLLTGAGLFCRRQITLRSGSLVTVSFHRLTLGAHGQILGRDLGSLQKPITTEDGPSHSFLSAVKRASSLIPKYPRVTSFLQINVRVWESQEVWRESRAVHLNQNQTQPPRPLQEMKSNHNSGESKIFLCQWKVIEIGSSGPLLYQKAGKLVDVVSTKICLCDLPYCCAGIWFRDFCV